MPKIRFAFKDKQTEIDTDGVGDAGEMKRRVLRAFGISAVERDVKLVCKGRVLDDDACASIPDGSDVFVIVAESAPKSSEKMDVEEDDEAHPATKSSTDEGYVLSVAIKLKVGGAARRVCPCPDGCSFLVGCGGSSPVIKRFRLDTSDGARKAGAHYVDCFADIQVPDGVEGLLSFPPGVLKECPEGGVVCSTRETVCIKSGLGAPIRVYDARGTQVKELRGHQRSVRALSWATRDTFLSGSFDGTARKWSLQTGASVVELKGHEGGVSCAMQGARDDVLVTGSSGASVISEGRSDAKLRMWSAATSPPTVMCARSEHASNVRGLAKVYANGRAASFVSTSNDGRIMLRDLGDGHVLRAVDLPSHPSIDRRPLIYDVKSSAEHDDGTFVTISDDQCLRVWTVASASGTVAQTFCQQHPRDLACVCLLGNGDIVTGDVGGFVRVFTKDRRRVARADALKKMDADLKASAKQTKVDPLNCPRYEDRASHPGREGAMKMFRQGLAKVVLCKFTSGQWTVFGNVENVVRHEKKKLGDKWYDEILSLDLPQGMLPVGFNYTDDPSGVADGVVDTHGLPEGFRSQIAEFIAKHQISKGFDYAADQKRKREAEKFNLKTYANFPADAPTSYTKANLDGMWSKIEEFAKELDTSATDLKEIRALVDVLRQVYRYHATTLPKKATEVIVGTCLSKWPMNRRFPIIDLVRVALTHSDADTMADAVRSLLGDDVVDDILKNHILTRLVLRVAVNAVASSPRMRVLLFDDSQSLFSRLLRILDAAVRREALRDRKLIQQAAAASVFNLAYAMHIRAPSRPVSDSAVTSLLDMATTLALRESSDRKTIAYAMRAAGTMIASPHIRPQLFGAKSLADLRQTLPKRLAAASGGASIDPALCKELLEAAKTLA